jgi:hypothetical protein
MELYYDVGAPGHRELGPTSSGLSPNPFTPEYGQYAARHDQSFQCMRLIVRRFLFTNLFSLSLRAAELTLPERPGTKCALKLRPNT